MPSVTFKCTLLTPLFMSGAGQDSWEVRPTSIKGLMAFWWRTANAHLPLEDSEEKGENGQPVHEGLYSLEGKLFGSTDRKSRFKIRVNSRLSEENNFTYREIEHFGARYLLFSMRRRTGAVATYNRQESTAFEVKLSSTDKAALGKALACFWLLSNLGGMGSRSRRGGGNIQASVLRENGEAISEAGLAFAPSPGQALGEYLGENARRCMKLLREGPAGQQHNLRNDYSHLRGAELVVSDKNEAHPMDALNDIGLFYMDFRQDETLTGDVDNLLEKAPMGLPIVTKNKITVKPENYERRASPLIFRVHRNAQGTYQWIVLKLNGQILPSGEGTVAQSRGRVIAQAPQLQPDIVDEFFNYVQNDKTELVQL